MALLFWPASRVPGPGRPSLCSFSAPCLSRRSARCCARAAPFVFSCPWQFPRTSPSPRGRGPRVAGYARRKPIFAGLPLSTLSPHPRDDTLRRKAALLGRKHVALSAGAFCCRRPARRDLPHRGPMFGNYSGTGFTYTLKARILVLAASFLFVSTWW